MEQKQKYVLLRIKKKEHITVQFVCTVELSYEATPFVPELLAF